MSLLELTIDVLFITILIITILYLCYMIYINYSKNINQKEEKIVILIPKITDKNDTISDLAVKNDKKNKTEVKTQDNFIIKEEVKSKDNSISKKEVKIDNNLKVNSEDNSKNEEKVNEVIISDEESENYDTSTKLSISEENIEEE